MAMRKKRKPKVRKPKMVIGKAVSDKRTPKAALAMKPTKGTDPSKPTAPALAAPMTGKKPKKMRGYRERMDSTEL